MTNRTQSNLRTLKSRNQREGWYATIYTMTKGNKRTYYRRRKGRVKIRDHSFNDFSNIRLYK